MNSLPECILFDLDGTLLDSLPGIESSIREAFKTLNLPLIREDFRALIGPPIRTILSLAGGITDEKQLSDVERAFRSHYDSQGWQNARCFPDVADVLRHLGEQGHRLFVVSNKPRQVSSRILERENILECFEAIITRDSRNPPYTDKAAMIRALLNDQGLNPANCLMIGDTMEDANACSAARVPFVFVTYGYGAHAESHSAAILKKLNALPELLELVGDHRD